MNNPTRQLAPEAQQAFAENERQITVRHLKTGCWLVMVLMPFGVLLDYAVYPEQVGRFLGLRLLCSLLEFLIWARLRGKSGVRFPEVWSLLVALLPAFFISWMIFETEGALSPYYAGLNLILLAIAFVLRWDVKLSLIAFLLVLAMYLGACLAHGSPDQVREFINNLYFLVLTGVIVVTGSRIHQELRVREFNLRFELDEQQRQLAESHRKLQELDQAKSRFFANISHELRTPLTLLLAPLEALLNRYRSRLDPDSLGLLQTMHGNGMRLLKLINDLLDIVRLESGKLEVRREALDLPEFLRGVASATRQMAEDKRIQLTTTVTPAIQRVMVDRDKLEKTLLNLVFNSLKFTPAGGRVEIRAAREGEELVLAVSDTGVGIAKEKLGNVFSRFWQADDSSRRKYQGVGIGLSLVKEFTELQGGTVAIDSDLGKGTTFTVRLPYLEVTAALEVASAPATVTDEVTDNASTPAPAEGGSTVGSQEWLSSLYRRAEFFPAMTAVRDALKPVETGLNSHLPKVLIADDEPDMLRFIHSQLKEHYQIIEAVDGKQAVEKAAQFLPDLVLTDMMMPEKDGLEVCRELRARASTQSIPVVLITARADEETKFAALEAGASDFLSKPFSTTELHVRVKNLIDSYQYQRRLAKQNRTLEQTIEELQETEIQLVQTEKLASLGRLSAGIIHEINNPLNFAATGLFTLKKKARLLQTEEQEEYIDVLRDVEEGLVRVKNIVSDLRSFSHQDHEQLDDVSIADVVASTLRFLSHEWKGKVHVETDIPRSLHVRSNKNKLIQVLINLVQNAIDASVKKPRTTDRPAIRISASHDANNTFIHVRDNGPGIAAENLDKVFDPFFTTKDVGQGMGLGLSICYRIVQQFGGRIRIESEPGQFAEFILEFPGVPAVKLEQPEQLHGTAA